MPLFQSTVSHNLRHFNISIFVLHLAAFSFTFNVVIFMLTTNTSSTSDSPHCYDFDALRNSSENITKLHLYSFIVTAHAIIALYSFFEIGASIWEISRGSTIFPEFSQLWLSFGHNQLNLTAFSTGVCQLVATGRIGGDVACQTSERDSYVIPEAVSDDCKPPLTNPSFLAPVSLVERSFGAAGANCLSKAAISSSGTPAFFS
ncbi:Uncharacterized protein family UPF0497, trans-membrane plant [Cynara cardunculus var. scolymus]|uniref:CASP-like protein n=1 Tax=Cynara cardunculus var. scolymus TaxID=59895 RepID=A0A118K079_CYNCS|nr:Uncharacterized protein family UPF0497, trans-membrane plant [Cynara cardunculus var. scolymus]